MLQPALIRYYFALVSMMLCATAAFAQPTFYFDPGQRVGDTGDIECLDFEVDDFTDILTIDFEIAFDSTVLAFNGVQNAALPGLSASNITLVGAGRGRLRFSWTAPNASSGIGEDFPDFTPIVRLCFELIGPYGSASNVRIADFPRPRITRQFSGTRNIGLFKQDALIAIGVLPLQQIIGAGSGAEMSTVCVDVRARNFTNIVSFQYSISWDPSVLQYVNVANTNPGLPGLDNSNFTSTMPGSLSVLYPDGLGTSPVSLPDDQVLYQLCFQLVGNCDESSTITITDMPVPRDAYNSNSPQPIGILANVGQVDVFACGGGLRVIGEVRAGSPGDAVCVPFTVRGFQLIEGMTFDIQWDPSILDFINVQVPGGVPAGFGTGSFNLTNAGTGLARVTWSGPPSSMPNGNQLFELCYTIIGPFGTNGDIAPITAGANVQQGGTNIGLNPRAGEVVILPSEQLEVTVGSSTQARLSEVCIDINVDNFDDLSTVRWSLNWEPTILRYVRVENFALPNAMANTFNSTSTGVLEFDWFDGPGSTLPDGARLMTVCFDVIGTPGACTPLEVTDSPRDIFVEAEATRGFNIGLAQTPGTVCVEDNRSFFVDIGNITAVANPTICVPLTVTSFGDVLTFGFSLAWDPTRFSYAGITSPADPTIVANTTETAAGRVGLEMDRTASGSGLTLADDAILLNICFNPLLPGEYCGPVLEEARPVTNAATETDGRAQVVELTDGQACVEEGISITGVVTNANCNNTADGEINITAVGGSGSYTYNWGGIPNNTNEDQTGLAANTYTVLVSDATNASVNNTATFTVASDFLAPIVLAGPDTTLDCNAAPLYTIDASATDLSGGKTLRWRMLQSGTSFVTDEDTLEPVVFGAGGFELTITTPEGCETRDTVYVNRTPAPIIEVVQQEDIDCEGNPATLEVRVTPPGNYDFSWTSTDGTFATGPVDVLRIDVISGGNYVFNLEDLDTGCEIQSSILVNEVTGTALAEAGPAQVLTCDVTTVQLGDASTTDGADYRLAWSTPDGALTGPTTAKFVNATQVGRYFITVEEISTGCIAIDSVDVTASTNTPSVSAGSAAALTCSRDTFVLQGSGSMGPDFSALWSTADGNLRAGTQGMFAATALTAGTYTLTVSNSATGCSLSSSVTLTDNTTGPVLQLPASLALGCDSDSANLIDPAFATDSTGFRFRWLDASLDTVSRTATLSNLSAQTYQLIVTDETNGCSSTRQVSVSVATPIEIGVVTNNLEFICGRDSLLFEVTANVADYTVSWIGLLPQSDVTDPTSFYAVVAGNYQPVVTDASGACSDTLRPAIVTIDNRTILTVDAGGDLVIECDESLVLADADAPDDASYTISWSSVSGSPITNRNSLQAGFSESGQYVLTFTDPATNCTGRDTVEVARNTADDLDVQLGGDLQINCDETSVELSAAVTAPTTEFTIEWVLSQNPAATFPVTQAIVVSDAGTYIVEVLYTPTGCLAYDTIEVTQAEIDFSLSANATQTIACGESEGDIAATFTPGSSTYSFEWTTTDGAFSAATDQPTTRGTAGTYRLIATDDVTGCTDSVTVELREGADLPEANFDVVADLCSTILTLTTTAQTTVDASWEFPAGTTVLDSSATEVTLDAAVGTVGSVTYSLSNAACSGTYSTSTQEVTFDARELSVGNDALTIFSGTSDTTFNVADNDSVLGEASYQLINAPATATISEAGVVSVTNLELGELLELTYQVCDLECADLCEQGTLIITVIDNTPPTVVAVPNTITPNGDGLNDRFIFDAIERSPEAYPAARLTVFNRWGDVLYLAQPYQNEWDGLTMEGKPVPQGTYYYVLELDATTNQILKGNITVLR